MFSAPPNIPAWANEIVQSAEGKKHKRCVCGERKMTDNGRNCITGRLHVIGDGEMSLSLPSLFPLTSGHCSSCCTATSDLKLFLHPAIKPLARCTGAYAMFTMQSKYSSTDIVLISRVNVISAAQLPEKKQFVIYRRQGVDSGSHLGPHQSLKRYVQMWRE